MSKGKNYLEREARRERRAVDHYVSTEFGLASIC